MKIFAACIAVGSLLLANLSQADEATGTLEKIKSTGVITIGNRDSSIPFSYTTGTGEPVGFAIDICDAVVAQIKTKLSLPDLKVRFQSVTSANRIPLIQNGTIDLECGSTTNSKERQTQVAFGLNYIMIGISAAVKADSNISTFQDLAGKKVVTTTGTTSITLLRAQKKDINFSEFYGKDHSDSFLMLSTGRADAFVMDDVLLAGQIAASPKPADYKIIKDVLRAEPYGVMLRKDDPDFKALVDGTVRELMTSGKMEKLYDKWFMTAIPPRGLNLNFPMSPATKDLYQNPNDIGI